MKLFLLCAFGLLPLALNGQTTDSVTIKQVDSLLQVVSKLQTDRDFDRSLLVLEGFQATITEKIGRKSAQYASWLFSRARVSIFKGGGMKDAEKWLLEAEDIHITNLKETHPEYSKVLYGLGAFVYYRTNDSLCEHYLMRTKILLEKTDRRKQVEYSRVLSALGNFYSHIHQLEKAENIMLESLQAIEVQKGKENADYALALDNLARIYAKQSLFPEAIGKLKESRDIKARTVGTKHPEYAKSLWLLGSNYKETGEFEQIESLYQEALSITETAYGRNHIQYSEGLENMAIFYITVLDDLEKGEQLMVSAREIVANLPDGKSSYPYMNVTKNLASLYLEMGVYKKSESLFEEVLRFFGTKNTNNFDYLALRLNMAILYARQQRYEESELVCREVLATQKQGTGTETILYAQTCMELGHTLVGRGAYTEAEKPLQESVDIYARIMGKQGLLYGEALNNMAENCQRLAQYDRAEQYYLEVLQVQEKAVGKQHSDYLFTLLGLANLYEKRGQADQAATYWLAYNQLARQLIEKSATYMSEQQMLAHLKTFVTGMNGFQHFAQRHPTAQFCTSVFDNNLLLNGLLLENARRLHTEAKLSDSLTQSAYARWQNAQRYLAVQYVKPLTERKRVAETEDDVQTLEKELARRLKAFGSVRHALSWQDVQKSLRSEEAAVEYLHYANNTADSVFYAALVLLAGADAPRFIPLFEERDIAALFNNKGTRKSEYVNALYAKANGQKSLYQAIWQPLETTLAGVKTVYYSPDGLLHRINHNAITDQNGKALSARYNLVQLGSTRQLVVPHAAPSSPNTNAQLYGGIQYDATPTVAAVVKPNTDDLASRRGADFAQNDSTLRGDNWGYLRWTELEINDAAQIMKANGITPTLLKGADATEESFKRIGTDGSSPRILHVATHGFFFPDPKGEKSSDDKTFKVSDNPMIRSGLVLAGGNHAWKTGKPLRPDLEDGILTAYEISQMNLSNTELVVLSACETGLGDLVGNEGVYGLQRAFKIAGAKYLIMSLWQVPDVQTQELMTVFYDNWLTKKMDIPDALRAAQQAMQVKYEHPFFWAGFVLVE
jgi:CHAT domain-containing protein